MATSRTALWILAVLLAALEHCTGSSVASDEFANPTHTPAVQIVWPHAGQVTAVSDDGLLIVYAAPEGSWVRVFVDNSPVAFTNSSRRLGRVAGLAAGAHVIEAHLLQLFADGQELVLARDKLNIYTCLCASLPGNALPPKGFSPFLPALENPYQPSQRYMHHEVFYLFGRWEGAAETGYLIDWLGVRTRYHWDCIKNGCAF